MIDVVSHIFGKTNRCCWSSIPIAIRINNTPTMKNPLWIVLYCAISANPIDQTISPVLVNVSWTPVISALCLTSTSCPINHKIIGRVSDSPTAMARDNRRIPKKLLVNANHHKTIPIQI